MNIYESQIGPVARFRTTIVPKSHVIVERIEGGQVVSMKRFEVGDQAEYDSFNLSYYGPIVSIGNKTISVKTLHGTTKRMGPDSFGWRNWNFDASSADAKNAETSLYI